MLNFDPVTLPASSEQLRPVIRAFIADNLPEGRRNSDFTSGYDAAFSAKLGAAGWIGMTIPRRYGGSERGYFDRYIVTEELLAAGMPVAAHWITDRQTAPLLMTHGTETQREQFLPGICAGTVFFSIGMSEPNAGSDLAAIQTRANRVDGGWLVNGTKVWTTGAHLNHYLMTLVRTSPPDSNRHAGMSQLIIDLNSDGVQVRPIVSMTGKGEFNEVVLTDVFVPDSALVGKEGDGWQQVTSELGYERSGPERFLSTFRVFHELISLLGPSPNPEQAAAVGRIACHLLSLRRLSLSVAGMLQAGKLPNLEAAMVKDLGTRFEKLSLEIARLAAPIGGERSAFDQALNDSLLLSPSFTLRGGTSEILRGMIARGMGLR
jgi:Acyl-CoA dehydrogenase, N-terminal domain/Acyl-CoA dehydrogenase, middle domain/Acyl-CoA dehydrogenase, C-terminal domain